MVSSSIGVELGWKWVNKIFFILSIKKGFVIDLVQPYL